MDSQTRDGIVRAGIAAPSADNSQPWQFVWSGNRLDLHIDASRSGSISDARQVLSDLAAGACLENMLVHARSLGYSAQVQTFPQPDQSLWVASMLWQQHGQEHAPEPLAEAIARRHTDRRFPWRGQIEAQARQRLDDQAKQIPGSRLWWPDNPQMKTHALAILRHAETLRFKSPSLRAELFSSVRFQAGWHATCTEGLAPATLAVEAPMRPLFQALRHPRVMAPLNRLGAASMLGWRSAWLPARLSPGLCLVVAASRSRPDLVAAGRAMQRVWLQATLEGLSVQPYAAAGVLSLGLVPIESCFRQSLLQLGAAMDALLQAQGHGLVFLRLGRPRTPPRWRNGRRDLADFGPPPGNSSTSVR